MENRTISLSAFDLRRLLQLIEERISSDEIDLKHLLDLKNELKQGLVHEPDKIPADIITMNSKVRIKDMDSDEEFIYTLVFPKEANIDNLKISILSPIGTALIGYRVGDIIEWPVPGGIRRLRVEEIIYQPEAAGDFHL